MALEKKEELRREPLEDQIKEEKELAVSLPDEKLRATFGLVCQRPPVVSFAPEVRYETTIDPT